MTGPKARTWSRFRRREKAAPQGYGSSAWGGGPLWADAFKSKRGPSPVEMVEAHKSILFFCSRFNSRAVSATPLRLYIRTEDGQTRPKSYMGPRPVGRWMKGWLRQKGYCTKFAAGSDEIEEVTGEHPILEAFRSVNPFLDLNQLISLTVTYTDLVGQAYWEPVLEQIGGLPVPKEIWILPAQVIWPVPDGISLVPKGYQYFSKLYLPEELIRFREPGMRNPYMDGNSPGRSVIEYARLEDEAMSVQDDMWSGGPRPSIIMSPKDEKVSIGEAERKRFRQEFNQMGARGRMGGIAIIDGAVNVTPVSWQPVDLGAMEINKYNLERIANGLDIPAPFYTKETNLANMQAAREFHAKNGVEPRCMGIASTLTRFFHAMDTGQKRGWERLFWAFDPVVEEDKKAASEQHTTYVKMGVINRDTVALELGYDALPDGLGQAYTVEGQVITLDSVVNPPELVAPAPGTMPGQEQGEGEPDEDDAVNDEEDQEAPPKNGKPKGVNGEGEHRYPFSRSKDHLGDIPPGDDPEEDEDNTFDLPDGDPIKRELKKWYRRIAKEVLGTMPEIGAHIATPPWPELADYTDPMASAMTPILSGYWDEAGKETRARLGLDPDEWRVVDPHLHEMIETQAHNFCQSTLDSTTETVANAYHKLNQEFIAGLVTQGETVEELTDRVRSIFTGLTKSHAETIARTEASRAVHKASEQSAIESEVVSGKIWLLSSNACPLCHRLEAASKASPVPLGGEFANIGSNPTYSSIRMPPGHPNCRCSVTFHLTPEYQAIVDANPPRTWNPGPMGPEPTADRKPTPEPTPEPTPKPKPDALGATFIRSPKAIDAKQPTVLANVASLDAGWKKDSAYYIPPGGGSDPQKYQNAVKFVQNAIANEEPIEQSRITVDEDGTVSFLDGRHRFAAMRDLGAKSVPVSVDKPDAARARRLHGEPKAS